MNAVRTSGPAAAAIVAVAAAAEVNRKLLRFVLIDISELLSSH
jgi:hypothetical protein